MFIHLTMTSMPSHILREHRYEGKLRLYEGPGRQCVDTEQGLGSDCRSTICY